VVQHLHTGERVKVCCRMQVLQLALHHRCALILALYECVLLLNTLLLGSLWSTGALVCSMLDSCVWLCRCMAVGLPQQVAIYELPAGAKDSDMGYRLTASIPCDKDSRCLALLGDAVAICQACTMLQHDGQQPAS
jgi:hypothetical protein